MPSFLSAFLRGTANEFCVRNTRTQEVLADHVEGAFDSSSRRTGLLRRDTFPEGSALIIAPTSAIHTWFMRFPIDVVFVAKDGRIVKTRRSLGPWKMTAALGAFAVIELPAGVLQRTQTTAGDHVAIVPR